MRAPSTSSSSSSFRGPKNCPQPCPCCGSNPNPASVLADPPKATFKFAPERVHFLEMKKGKKKLKGMKVKIVIFAVLNPSRSSSIKQQLISASCAPKASHPQGYPEPFHFSYRAVQSGTLWHNVQFPPNLPWSSSSSNTLNKLLLPVPAFVSNCPWRCMIYLYHCVSLFFLVRILRDLDPEFFKKVRIRKKNHDYWES